MNKSNIYKAKEDKDIQEDLRKLQALQKELKALEQEQCEDCISRQAAIDTFGLSEKTRKYGGDHSGYDTIMLYEVQDALEALPSVNPQKPKTGHWIPVSDRLPKDGGDYLVTIVFDIGDKEPVREVKKDYFCILSKKWLYENENIIAWMPLPEPYKAESEE